jgi:hypothetical protein
MKDFAGKNSVYYRRSLGRRFRQAQIFPKRMRSSSPTFARTILTRPWRIQGEGAPPTRSTRVTDRAAYAAAATRSKRYSRDSRPVILTAGVNVFGPPRLPPMTTTTGSWASASAASSTSCHLRARMIKGARAGHKAARFPGAPRRGSDTRPRTPRQRPASSTC